MYWIGLILLLSLAWAQSEKEVIFLEEETATGYTVPERDDIEIYVNGERQQLKEEMVIPKNKVLDIQVRYLKPGSYVTIQFQKAGVVKSQKRRFTANHRGELDLQVKTPKQRVKGIAEVIYYSSSGKKHHYRIKVMVR